MRLLFISPRFLFPLDNGGAIRTTQILRGMKGGPFEITLLSPVKAGQEGQYANELNSVCDHFFGWQEPQRSGLHHYTRLRRLGSPLPIPVIEDYTVEAAHLVTAELAKQPDLVVFDFLHTAVLAPEQLTTASLLFTHNVETEIFARHYQTASNPAVKLIWGNQYRKMQRFEAKSLQRFDTIVAVSGRDKRQFQQQFAATRVSTIPTAVDLSVYPYRAPADNRQIIFIGSMDSMANIDGIDFFMTAIWSQITARYPDAALRVVGRNPAPSLISKASSLNWQFTGSVADVNEHVRDGAVYIVPLRVGGGTRIKVYEAMALGLPVVSTTIGVEGLDIQADKHYLRADQPQAFAQAVLRLLDDAELRQQLSRDARQHVERHFSAEVAARAFETICLKTVAQFQRKPLAN